MPSLYMNNKIIWLHTTQEPILLLFSGFKTVFYTPHLAIIATATFDDRFERKYALYYMKKTWTLVLLYCGYYTECNTPVCLTLRTFLDPLTLLKNWQLPTGCYQTCISLWSVKSPCPYFPFHGILQFMHFDYFFCLRPPHCPEPPSSHLYQLDHKKEHLYFIFTFKFPNFTSN